MGYFLIHSCLLQLCSLVPDSVAVLALSSVQGLENYVLFRKRKKYSYSVMIVLKK